MVHARSLTSCTLLAFLAAALLGDRVDGGPTSDGAEHRSRTIKVAGILFDHARTGDYKERNYRAAESLIREAAAAGAQLVCTCEQFLDGYGCDANKMQGASDPQVDRCEALGKSVYVPRLSELARDLQITILAGVAMQEGSKTYNSALLFDSTGALTGIYRKTHNAGKYAHWFAPLTAEQKQAACPSFPIGEGRLSVKICNDRRFPETTNLMVKNGCELLLCPAYGKYTPDKLVDDSRRLGLWAVFVHPQGCQFIDRGKVVLERTRQPGERCFVLHEVEFRTPVGSAVTVRERR